MSQTNVKPLCRTTTAYGRRYTASRVLDIPSTASHEPSSVHRKPCTVSRVKNKINPKGAVANTTAPFFYLCSAYIQDLDFHE